MLGSKMYTFTRWRLRMEDFCQATRTHSTAWLTSKPTGNSWRPHGPGEVGWCSRSPLSLGNLFEILPMIWVATSLISFLSFFSPSPVVLQNSEIFGLHRLWWVEQGSEFSCVATVRIGNRVDSWVNCHAGWVGVYCWCSNKSSITHWLWGFWVRKNPLVRERGKTKHWLQLVLPHFDIFPSYSLAIPCMLHSPTFGTV